MTHFCWYGCNLFGRQTGEVSMSSLSMPQRVYVMPCDPRSPESSAPLCAGLLLIEDSALSPFFASYVSAKPHLFDLLNSLFSFSFLLSVLLPSFHGSGAGPPCVFSSQSSPAARCAIQNNAQRSICMTYLSELLLALRTNHWSYVSALWSVYYILPGPFPVMLTPAHEIVPPDAK